MHSVKTQLLRLEGKEKCGWITGEQGRCAPGNSPQVGIRDLLIPSNFPAQARGLHKISRNPNRTSLHAPMTGCSLPMGQPGGTLAPESAPRVSRFFPRWCLNFPLASPQHALDLGDLLLRDSLTEVHRHHPAPLFKPSPVSPLGFQYIESIFLKQPSN